MVLREELPMIHPVIIIVVIVATMVTIAELKPLTSLEELSTHIQDAIIKLSKLKWAMYTISHILPMSTITCAGPHHTCTQE